jgi:hypothetical protein
MMGDVSPASGVMVSGTMVVVMSWPKAWCSLWVNDGEKDSGDHAVTV